MKKSYIISFILVTLISCSKTMKVSKDVAKIFDDKGNADSIVSKILPKWFTGSRKFSLLSSSGGDAFHMFYDVSPEIDLEDNTVNFIITTPEGSLYRYDVDQVSGQHYLDGKFCKQEDVWKRSRSTIFLPPVTMGYIPKILDQLGTPQKIIVFGDKKHYSENFTSNFFEAKIIGGFIEQECHFGGCFERNDWKSRVVLIGVQNEDSEYSSVTNLDELKKKVDWRKVVSFLENGQGRNKVVDNFYPAFRKGVDFSKDRALSYLDKKSIFLTNKKLLTMRRSCHRLYNYIFDKIYMDSKFEVEMKKAKTYKDQVKVFKSFDSSNRSLFHKRFISAFKKYNEQYTTCIGYIYPSNINNDRKRHWFFAYYTALHRLYNAGYSYNCGRKSWDRVVTVGSGVRAISLEKEFQNCNSRSIENAFVSSIKELEILGVNSYESYRYIDYDNSSIGTHKKIYSWVKRKNKSFECIDKEKINQNLSFEHFPEDVNWEREKLPLKGKRKIID